MHIPRNVATLDLRVLKLLDLIDIASASLREKGEEQNAVTLFRLRINLREGLSYEKAKVIFDNNTKTLFEEK